MPFASSIRSLGRAGLFSLTVLRGSLPTRDFLAELTREIYKIGARSLPIIAVGGAFVARSPPSAPPMRCPPCSACRCTASWHRC